MDSWKRELTGRDKSAAEKQNVIMLEVKFELSVNGVIEEIAERVNVDTSIHYLRDSRYSITGNLWGQIIDITEQNGFEWKDENAPKEKMLIKKTKFN